MAKRAGTKPKGERSRKKRAAAPPRFVVHDLPCLKCRSAGAVCEGTEGISCERCKLQRKTCEYASGGRPLAEPRTTRAASSKSLFRSPFDDRLIFFVGQKRKEPSTEAGPSVKRQKSSDAGHTGGPPASSTRLTPQSLPSSTARLAAAFPSLSWTSSSGELQPNTDSFDLAIKAKLQDAQSSLGDAARLTIERDTYVARWRANRRNIDTIDLRTPSVPSAKAPSASLTPPRARTPDTDTGLDLSKLFAAEEDTTMGEPVTGEGDAAATGEADAAA